MAKNAPAFKSTLLLLSVGVFTLAGCKKIFGPTYPGAKIAESVVEISATDYKRMVEARRIGQSLQIMTTYTGEVESALTGIDKGAADVLDDVLQAATRVTLSTDKPPEFVEVFLRNPLTGATFGIWRYVDDMKRFMHTGLPTMESMERMVLVHDEVEDGRWPRPVSFPEFLARQVVQRVKRQAGVEAREDLSEPDTLGIVLEGWPATSDAAARDLAIEAVGQSTKTVLQSYRLNGFRGIVLKDGSTGTLLRRWAL